MPIPTHIQQAIQAYYAERPSDEDIAALEDWFREDEAHIKAFAEHGMLEWQMLCEHEKQDAAAILTLLREAEDNAEPDYSLLHQPAIEPTPVKEDAALTLGEVCSIASYALAKGLRAKAGQVASLAAVLILGAVLYLSIFGLGTTPAPQKSADNTPTKPAASAQPTPRGSNTTSPVATLTATHNAQWAERVLAPGSELKPGQRLTLTAGFAEITTSRGAIAILEAPATIELLDHSNALRLHTGKLVGICVTPSSKGLLVRTPHMDITDLGTRFGVGATQADSAEVHVFDGEVAVAAAGADEAEEPMRLLAGESAGTSPTLGTIVKIDHAAHAFTAFMPRTVQLPSTGAGLSIGQIDPAWSITQIDGVQLDTPLRPTIFTDAHHVSDESTPGGAQWIVWVRQGDAARKEVTYLFETRVSLPGDLDTETAHINLQCAVDNRLRAIVVNGQRVPINQSEDTYEMLAYRVDRHLVPGENIIAFEIFDVGRSSSTVNHAGLQLVWELQTAGPSAFEAEHQQP